MSALPKVPDEISISNYVRVAWESLHSEILKGTHNPSSIARIERSVKDQVAMYKNGELVREYDWELDIDVAWRLHELNLDWQKKIELQTTSMFEMWKGYSSSAKSFGLEMTKSSIQYVFIAHGAIGLSSFAALAAPKINSNLFYAAICGIAGALVGILALALGTSLMLETLGAMGNHIQSKFVRPFTFATAKGLQRAIGRKVEPKLKNATRLIYFSVVWLLIYVFVGLVLLVQPNG